MRRSQAGQVGVLIVLIMAVMLTAGLSVASRTTQELFISKQSEDTTRVFNAAEAGIEEALSEVNAGDDLAAFSREYAFNETTVNYAVNPLARLETKLFEGVTGMVKLREPAQVLPAGASVRIGWGRESASCEASLLVSVLGTDGSGTTARHFGLSGCTRTPDDAFVAVTQAGCADGFNRCTTLSLLPTDEYIRVKPLYGDTDIQVFSESITLPTQAYSIRSQAKNNNGNETRIVEVTRTLPTAPSVMDYTLFSGGDIVKQ